MHYTMINIKKHTYTYTTEYSFTIQMHDNAIVLTAYNLFNLLSNANRRLKVKCNANTSQI